MPDTVRPIDDLLTVLFPDGLAPGTVTEQTMRDLIVSLKAYTDAAIPANIVLTYATKQDIWAGTDTAKIVTAKVLADAMEFVAISYASGTPALNMATFINAQITGITGNLTLPNPTNAKAGKSGSIRIAWDAVANRTLTVGSNWKPVEGSQPVSGIASAIDYVDYQIGPGGLISYTVRKNAVA